MTCHSKGNFRHYERQINGETFRDIPGLEGMYAVSKIGTVLRLERVVFDDATGNYMIVREKALMPAIVKRHRGGKFDAKVGIMCNGTKKTLLVSRLVALAWCEGYSPGLTVNHKDGNPLNNHAKNLEWITQKENNQHAVKTGLRTWAKGCELVSDNGESVMFDSMSEASNYLKRSPTYIRICLLRGSKARSPDGKVFDIRI